MGGADSLTETKAQQTSGVASPDNREGSALQALSAFLKDDMEACNREIVARMQSLCR